MLVLSELRKPPGYELGPAVFADILPIDDGHMSRLRSHPSLARQDSVLGFTSPSTLPESAQLVPVPNKQWPSAVGYGQACIGSPTPDLGLRLSLRLSSICPGASGPLPAHRPPGLSYLGIRHYPLSQSRDVPTA